MGSQLIFSAVSALAGLAATYFAGRIHQAASSPSSPAIPVLPPLQPAPAAASSPLFPNRPILNALGGLLTSSAAQQIESTLGALATNVLQSWLQQQAAAHLVPAVNAMAVPAKK